MAETSNKPPSRLFAQRDMAPKHLISDERMSKDDIEYVRVSDSGEREGLYNYDEERIFGPRLFDETGMRVYKTKLPNGFWHYKAIWPGRSKRLPFYIGWSIWDWISCRLPRLTG